MGQLTGALGGRMAAIGEAPPRGVRGCGTSTSHLRLVAWVALLLLLVG